MKSILNLLQSHRPIGIESGDIRVRDHGTDLRQSSRGIIGASIGGADVEDIIHIGEGFEVHVAEIRSDSECFAEARLVPRNHETRHRRGLEHGSSRSADDVEDMLDGFRSTALGALADGLHRRCRF